jgi:Prealbumin-like fold domain
MATRILGPAGGRRRRRLLLLLPLAAIAALVFALTASGGPIGTASGFEDDDGNLVVNSTFDWNGFNPVTWNGTAPYQNATKVASGWNFTGLTDAQATTSDSGFAGGIKQDVNCPTLKNGKAPNKDDLKRLYVAFKTVNGHTYLNLAWVRIPQNTVNSSTHVGFEFNQSTTACPGGSPLVQRTAGDLLFVYDFEGSSSGNATLTVRRWVSSGACEISQNTAPCWGPAQDLTASGFAEAKVNSTATTLDAVSIGSGSPAIASPGQTLGISEFGEAGADLTAAGIFSPGACAAFGQVEGVSRSSGNSGQAAMEDLVGPGHINLTNCGEVKIIKHTNPRGVDQNFDYTSTLAGSELTCSQPSPETATSFTLNDAGNTTDDSAANTQDCTKVPIGNYTVTEGADPNGFAFDSLSCTATGSGTGSQDGTVAKQANIAIVAGGDTVTCTYVNNQQLGAIKISKTNSKTGNALAGATFSIKSGGTPISGSPFTTDANGEICVDNLPFGDYSVQETGAPSGYAIDDSTAHTVTVDNNAKCSDSPYVGETASFSDTPTSDIQVRFRDGGSGTTSATISCDNTTGTTSTTGTTGWDDTTTVTGIHAPTTVTCTIAIDP